MKINHIALAICLGMVPLANAVAAPVQQTLKFSTIIPEPDFTITPTRPWPTAVTPLAYDKVKEIFTPYANDVRITSLTLNVTAKLEKAANLVNDSNSDAVIPLQVKLGDKTITLDAQQIHVKGGGAPYPLSIQPIGKGYPGGTYAGDVVLIFDGV
ncbi:MAG TPA: hypothetical protein VK519_01435 [Pinirhizobacter sp.]|uniref:hypothetical protein n=1 Tax=Pinirhizobacter sp. TaxID=2950432 RepID=UPI002CE9F49E|nr:hypothetical protein [Pinirhizobacter sp.]HMH66560.1 hypothetical protein [Pinirhizobacter sp.]